MTRINLTITLGVALAVAAAAPPIGAGIEPPTHHVPVGLPKPIFGPTIITAPGRYVVQRDLDTLNSAFCIITIAASDVDLDLNGYRLGIERGKLICASDVSEIRVHDGVLVTGAVGDDANGVVFENVDSFALRRLTAYAPAEHAFLVHDSHHGVIEDNRILGTTEGISVTGSDITISRNVVNAGLAAEGEGLRIIGNVLTSTPGAVSDVGEIGVRGRWNVIEGNFAGSLALDDVHSSDNLIRNNVLHGALGLSVTGHHNEIVGNFCTAGSGFGLVLRPGSAGNSYGRNRAFGNAGTDCPAGGADFCDYGTGNVSLGGNYLPDPM
jgi:parallel beta-helix repeat protein